MTEKFKVKQRSHQVDKNRERSVQNFGKKIFYIEEGLRLRTDPKEEDGYL